ncbi:NUDIX domain-containing protein [Patescibacteria group bacterium]
MNKERDFYQVSLKLILKNSNEEILLVKTLPENSGSNYYELPGGRINTDEFTVPLTEILQREISEEIGEVKYKLNPVPVAVARHLIPANITAKHKDIHVLYVIYEATYISGDITLSDEHPEFQWIDLIKNDPEQYLNSGNLEGMRMYYSRKKTLTI